MNRHLTPTKQMTLQTVVDYGMYLVARLKAVMNSGAGRGAPNNGDGVAVWEQRALAAMETYLASHRVRESMAILGSEFPDHRARLIWEVHSRNPVESFYAGRILGLWSVSRGPQKSSYLWHISQSFPKFDDYLCLEIASGLCDDPDPTVRGELAYALRRHYRQPFEAFIARLEGDAHTWVRSQAWDSIAKPLDYLLNVVADTKQDFRNENRRYQALAKIRTVMREEVFGRFADNSKERAFAVLILNATSGITAKKLRPELLNTLEASLRLMLSGCDNDDTRLALERRLLSGFS